MRTGRETGCAPGAPVCHAATNACLATKDEGVWTLPGRPRSTCASRSSPSPSRTGSPRRNGETAGRSLPARTVCWSWAGVRSSREGAERRVVTRWPSWRGRSRAAREPGSKGAGRRGREEHHRVPVGAARERQRRTSPARPFPACRTDRIHETLQGVTHGGGPRAIESPTESDPPPPRWTG